VLLAVQGQRAVDFPVARDFVDFLEVPVQPLIVIVSPAAPLLKGAPRQVAEDLSAPRELI